MIKKLEILLTIVTLMYGVLGNAKPATILKNSKGHEVFIYELPAEANEKSVEELINELKDLPTLGVGQLMVDDISTAYLAKVNSGFAKLCGQQAWDEIGIQVNYLDVRVTERVALTIHSIAMLNAMDYLTGSSDLEHIYQQWGFTAEQAKKLKERYQALFSPLCQQIRQTVTKVSNPPSQREAEQLATLGKKFEQCFVDHFFIIFGVTRKALAAEHTTLLQEIASYKDGQLLEVEYKKIIESFKKSAPWLSDMSAEETLSAYARRCDILSADEKKALELFKQKNPAEAPAIEDINLMKIVSAGWSLVAIRAVHAIVNSDKAAALFILEPGIQDSIEELLDKAGYAEVTPEK